MANLDQRIESVNARRNARCPCVQADSPIGAETNSMEDLQQPRQSATNRANSSDLSSGPYNNQIYHMTSPSTINCRLAGPVLRSAIRAPRSATKLRPRVTLHWRRLARNGQTVWRRGSLLRLADPVPVKINAMIQDPPGMGLTASSHADYCTIRMSKVAYQGSWAPPATGSRQSTEARRRCAKAPLRRT